mmetsp:Transcript_55168/g.120774  ORF Transcript_55168/g.120774 Transcript_55168/m.120774 type:complete len:85 (+) Transcript_55168:1301-1555(+)
MAKKATSPKIAEHKTGTAIWRPVFFSKLCGWPLPGVGFPLAPRGGCSLDLPEAGPAVAQERRGSGIAAVAVFDGLILKPTDVLI